MKIGDNNLIISEIIIFKKSVCYPVQLVQKMVQLYTENGWNLGFHGKYCKTQNNKNNDYEAIWYWADYKQKKKFSNSTKYALQIWALHY